MKRLLVVLIAWGCLTLVSMFTFLRQASRHGLNDGRTAQAALLVAVVTAITTFRFHQYRNRIR